MPNFETYCPRAVILKHDYTLETPQEIQQTIAACFCLQRFCFNWSVGKVGRCTLKLWTVVSGKGIICEVLAVFLRLL